jgi:hypothetical protein
VSDLDDTLAQIDLKDWLDDQGISYKSAGTENVRLRECVFCGDSRSKVYISTKNKKGICYAGSCSKGAFNLYSFAREHLHLDNHGTITHFNNFARSSGLSVRATVAPPVAVTTSGWEMPSSVNLPTLEDATHPFLTERRITLETQRRFELRWCEQGYHTYKDGMGNQRTQDFSQRVLIPVADLDGVIKSFQGRATWQVDEEQGERRYLFPTALPGTGRFLYGGNLVKGVPNLVINEGPFDA